MKLRERAFSRIAREKHREAQVSASRPISMPFLTFERRDQPGRARRFAFPFGRYCLLREILHLCLTDAPGELLLCSGGTKGNCSLAE